MSMSIGAVGSSYPIAGAKHDKPEDSALTALTSTITPTTTDLHMVPESALVRISNLADFQEGAVAWTSDGDALAKARAAGAYGLASLDAPVEPLRAVAPPEALREVSGLGFIPGEVFTSKDAGALTDYLRDEVADARAAARRERALSDEAGEEVRLAFDPNTGREVGLTRDDPAFDAVRGARAMFAAMGDDLRKMGVDPKDFLDLLRL